MGLPTANFTREELELLDKDQLKRILTYLQVPIPRNVTKEGLVVLVFVNQPKDETLLPPENGDIPRSVRVQRIYESQLGEQNGTR